MKTVLITNVENSLDMSLYYYLTARWEGWRTAPKESLYSVWGTNSSKESCSSRILHMNPLDMNDLCGVLVLNPDVIIHRSKFHQYDSLVFEQNVLELKYLLKMMDQRTKIIFRADDTRDENYPNFSKSQIRCEELVIEHGEKEGNRSAVINKSARPDEIEGLVRWINAND